MKVGIFDSGIGGITVLKEAMERLPQVEYIYYADNLHVPYGTKPKEEVIGYVKNVVHFLMSQRVDAILIACNTATSVAINELRATYHIPIIGMEPAVKLALDRNPIGRILVTATPLSLKEERYRNLVAHLDRGFRTSALPLPELVTFAETRQFNEKMLIDYFKEKLRPYQMSEYVGLVLGCTHFIYFKKYIREVLPPRVKIYDGNAGTVRQLAKCLGLPMVDNTTDKPKVTFYYSGEKCASHEILDYYLSIA